jgi:hypothetical protein
MLSKIYAKLNLPQWNLKKKKKDSEVASTDQEKSGQCQVLLEDRGGEGQVGIPSVSLSSRCPRPRNYTASWCLFFLS